MVRQNIDPGLWGAVFWDLLFHHAFHPAGDEGALARVLESLPHILPCASCRTSCASFCKMFPPSAIRTNGASVWLWTLKDTVNQKVRARGALYSKVKRRYMCYPGGIVSDDAVLVLILCIVSGADTASMPHVREFVDALSSLCVSIAPVLQTVDWEDAVGSVRSVLSTRVGGARVDALVHSMLSDASGAAAVAPIAPKKRNANTARA